MTLNLTYCAIAVVLMIFLALMNADCFASGKKKETVANLLDIFIVGLLVGLDILMYDATVPGIVPFLILGNVTILFSLLARRRIPELEDFRKYLYIGTMVILFVAFVSGSFVFAQSVSSDGTFFVDVHW